MRELVDLIPQLQEATDGSDFGPDAISKARRALETARQVVERGDTTRVTESIDVMTRTLSLFRGVLQRIGR